MKNILIIGSWFIILNCLFSFTAYSNNLQIDRLEILSSKRIQMDIAWNNSWNLNTQAEPYNHDAVWIFAKYQANDQGPWLPVKFHVGLIHHRSANVLLLAPEGATDGMGVMVKRKADGQGNIEPTTIYLGLKEALPAGAINLQVYGIEMVYVPRGDFWLGDGESLYTFRRGSNKFPFKVTTDRRISTEDPNDESLTATDNINEPAHALPAAYPKGHKAFYCMKYEISQDQYRDFLNTLTFEQQVNRIDISPESAVGRTAFDNGIVLRNGIVIRNTGVRGLGIPAFFACNSNNFLPDNEYNDGQNRACNLLNWGDIAAYLDWAGLRPMTELEYEKACRGPLKAVEAEYAWGNANIVDANIIRDDGSPNERAIDDIFPDHGIANHGYDGLQGPIRCGFAAQELTDRLQSGATYYGILEMSGNVWETCINVNEKGLQFEAYHGNGNLDINGHADVPTWPNKEGEGTGYRGGGWNSGVNWSPYQDLAVSDRYYAFLNATQRRDTSGGRGVRSW